MSEVVFQFSDFAESPEATGNLSRRYGVAPSSIERTAEVAIDRAPRDLVEPGRRRSAFASWQRQADPRSRQLRQQTFGATMSAVRLSKAELSELIGAIYDCALEPSLWADTMERMRSDMVLANAATTVHDMRNGTLLVAAAAGIPDDVIAAGPRYADAIHDLWGGAERINTYLLDEPILQSSATPRASWNDNAWYVDMWRDRGIVDVAIIPVLRDADAVGAVAFGMTRDADDEDMDVLRLLGPHIRRALSISRILDMQSVAAANLAAIFDKLAAAAILISQDLAIEHANATARGMMRDGDAIREVGGRLSILSPMARDAVIRAVQTITDGVEDLGPRGIGVPLRRNDGTPSVAHVMPLTIGAARHHVGRGVKAAIFIAPSERQCNCRHRRSPCFTI